MGLIRGVDGSTASDPDVRRLLQLMTNKVRQQTYDLRDVFLIPRPAVQYTNAPIYYTTRSAGN
jgi:hypothetical protein